MTLNLILSIKIADAAPGWWVGEEAERSDGPTLTENQWDVLLQQTGFSGLDGYLPDNLDEPQEPAMGGVMFSTAVSETSQNYAKASLLLTDQSQSPNIGQLETSLVDLTGKSPDVFHFEDVGTGSIDGKTWIVLAFETFSLLHLSETRFATLQNLLLRGQAVLWVTRGARNSSPEASMIDGLARVIRSENAGVKLVTLDLSDSPALSDIDTASVISSVYARVSASDTAYNLEDLEFVEDKGTIDVRRVVEHVDKDRYIMLETQQPIPEPQPFVQTGRNLRLKIGTPGLLDSIYFEDDPRTEQPVADDEVELEIMATGVRWPNAPPLNLLMRML